MPAMPQSAAGPRIEPPVSEPVPPRIIPAATAAPVPEEEPAVKRVGVPGIARRRPGQVEARAAAGEFMGGELAEHHHPGRGPSRRRCGVARRDVVLQHAGMAGGGDARGLVDVLVGEGDAVQRAARAVPADCAPRRRGPGQRAVLA